MLQSKDIDLTNTQVGVIGDHNIIYGGVHYHIEPPVNSRERRNRQSMLQLVYNTWIKGLLEQSLHGAALLELGMEYNPEAVEHPWDMLVQTPERPDKTVPPGTRIVDVFEDVSGALLILGEPGSGKTTMLLELARDLITRAEQDETLHIPVVFNLSSWAIKQSPLEEWLVEELRTKYYIPKKIAEAWVKEDTLLLLLDGLDEVKAEARDKCVAAINAYRQAHLIPLAVCSRIADYEALNATIHLRGAICLHPLTPAQIDAYLVDAGMGLCAVRATLKHDPVLQEMAKSPLFLSIITLAYRGKDDTDLQNLATLEARRQHLFDAYTERMFQRRGKDQYYTPEQTRHWLAWLAGQMTFQYQSIFLIENLQPSWFPEREHRRIRRLALLALISANGSVAGISSALFMWFYVGFSTDIELGIGLLSGLIFGVVVGLLTGLLLGLLDWMGVWELRKVEPVETLSWSWQVARNRLSSGLINTPLIAGLLVTGLLSGVFASWVMDAGLINGLIIGLGIVLSLGMLGGLVIGSVLGKIDSRTIPNQGICQSFKNAISIGLIVWLLSGLVISLTTTLGLGIKLGVTTGLFSGLILGMSGFEFGGGTAVILHYTLRFFLYRANHAPRRYIHFLDHCANLIFLRKVGGGYIFVHRSLRDHFALEAISPSKVDRRSSRSLGDATVSQKQMKDFNKQDLGYLKNEVQQPVKMKQNNRLLLLPIILVCLLACLSYVYIASMSILSGRTVRVSMYLTTGNYDKAIELAPEDAQIYYMRGQSLYCEQENYELALADYQKAAKLSPDNVGYWNTICWGGSIAGQAADVFDACEQAVALLPDNGSVVDSRGLAHALIGDYIGAIADFQAYIQWIEDFSLEYDEDVILRRAWIAALEAGQNPFDEAALDTMRQEFCSK